MEHVCKGLHEILLTQDRFSAFAVFCGVGSRGLVSSDVIRSRVACIRAEVCVVRAGVARLGGRRQFRRMCSGTCAIGVGGGWAAVSFA